MIHSNFNFNARNFTSLRQQQQQKLDKHEEQPAPQPLDPGCPGVPGPSTPTTPEEPVKGLKDNVEKQVDAGKLEQAKEDKKDDFAWTEYTPYGNNNGFTCIMPPVKPPTDNELKVDESIKALDAQKDNKLEKNLFEKKADSVDDVSRADFQPETQDSVDIEGFISDFANGTMSKDDFIAKLNEIGATDIVDTRMLGPGLSVDIVVFKFNGQQYEARHVNHMQQQNPTGTNTLERHSAANNQIDRMEKVDISRAERNFKAD